MNLIRIAASQGSYDKKPPPNTNHCPCALATPLTVLILNAPTYPIIRPGSKEEELINSIFRPDWQSISSPNKETFETSTMRSTKPPNTSSSSSSNSTPNYLNIFGTSTSSSPKPSSKPTRPSYKLSGGSVYSFDTRTSAITSTGNNFRLK